MKIKVSRTSVTFLDTDKRSHRSLTITKVTFPSVYVPSYKGDSLTDNVQAALTELGYTLTDVREAEKNEYSPSDES